QRELDQAERLAIQTDATPESPRWVDAIASVHRAQGLLDSSGGNRALRGRVDATLGTLPARERDHKMRTELDEALLLGRLGSPGSSESMFAASLTAFRGYGIDLDSLSIDEAASRIRASAIRENLVAAIDIWAADQEAHPDRRKSLREIAHA